MRSGTLFSKYEPCCFGGLAIKGESTEHGDFFVQEIAGAVAFDSTEDFVDTLTIAVKTGERFDMDFETEARDGLFDADQLFAVWDRNDVEALIERLQRTIA